jgi:hypothetical protein
MPTEGRSIDRGPDTGFPGTQQHAGPVDPVQQDRAVFAEHAVASPASDTIPTIAARTTDGSRKWLRMRLMEKRPKLPRLPR